jgi:hypothetical protein
MTIAECWCLARSWVGFLKFLAWKLVGGYPFRFFIPRTDALQRIDPQDLPDGFRDRFLGLLAEVEKAGLGRVFVHRPEVLERSRVVATAVLLDPTGTVIGTAASTSANQPTAGEVALTTHFTDGTTGITTTARRLYRPQPTHLIPRHRSLAPAGLLERHRQYLAGWEREGKLPRSFNAEELPGVILEAHHRYIEFYAAAGLFIPMTDEEVARARGAGR